MIDFHRLLSAFQTVRRELLTWRQPQGHWVGEVSNSAIATASAASALSIVARTVEDETRRNAYQQLACRAVDWLAAAQNQDGGWGDTVSCRSNAAATMLANAAIHLSAQSHRNIDRLSRAEKWLDSHDGLAGLRRQCARDPALFAAILGNSSLAGQTAWHNVPQMAFELAWLPRRLQAAVGAAEQYAEPVRVGMGQARFFHHWPRNPIALLARSLSVGRSLTRLERVQPPSGGFLEAVPWTAFLVMGLAATGRANHPLARRGLGFLLDTVRSDASWPIDADLSVWNTALAIHALASASGDVGALGCLDWLLDHQKSENEPQDSGSLGGWGCGQGCGSPGDTVDTAAALLALSVLLKSGPSGDRPRIETAATAGICWLLSQQGRDGGWPTFSGDGREAFPTRCVDATSHALRALRAWQYWSEDRAVDEAIRRGLRYLGGSQRADGSWRPLWFASENWPNEENPICGTTQALLAYRDLDRIESSAAERGLAWLAAAVDPGGGWGGGPGESRGPSNIEETALSVEALLAAPNDPGRRRVLETGLEWLVRAVEESRHRQAAVICLRPGGFWYHEKVFPLAVTVSVLGQAVKLLSRPG